MTPPLANYTREHHAKRYDELCEMSSRLLNAEEGVMGHLEELDRLLRRMGGHLTALRISAGEWPYGDES